MKRAILNILLIVTAAPAYASVSAADAGGAGLMTKLFLAFLAMIIVCQLVPGLVLFVSMIKGLFSRGREEASLMGKMGK